MTDPITLTASTILLPRGYSNATLAFQEFIKSRASELAKKFTAEAMLAAPTAKMG